jgi:hypothetical protein
VALAAAVVTAPIERFADPIAKGLRDLADRIEQRLVYSNTMKFHVSEPLESWPDSMPAEAVVTVYVERVNGNHH